ncbi:hypothetical protein B0H17DRAFT_1201671 [Mycena rosella]|uniref:Uncharacterized protein n=1 Tax=Mycena rosella TaxID=1033263 RepID=A0AAD7DGB9_MYCRO|nr:hypothetical protein B0H17DRAFT_1201671 [Mycena rosella]
MSTQEPRLSAPYPRGPNEAAEEDSWEADIRIFVTILVRYRISNETTAEHLLSLFDAPENDSLVFYYACIHLLRATRRFHAAGQHIALIATLFRLLKEEGLRRDDPSGEDAFGLSFLFPTLRRLASLRTMPIPPGYEYIACAGGVTPDPKYVKDGSFLTQLARYGRQQEGMVRLWSLVGRLEADRVLGEPGGMSLLLNSGIPDALEYPAQRGVWERLWAALLRCGEDKTFGEWGPEKTRAYQDVARKIARDDRVSWEWRGRFALLLEELEKEI